MDFAAGAVLLALVAAYTLGTRGSELGFSDSMLVAGRRAEAVAVISGMAFALGNICFLATTSLIGLPNAVLLTFTVWGCGVSLFHLGEGQSTTSLAGCIVLLAGAGMAVISARSKRSKPTAAGTPAKSSGTRQTAVRSNPSPGGFFRGPVSASTKGIITGILAGLSFVVIIPLLSISQQSELGIGAYGGILLGSLGLLGATTGLNFFFLNISLEGGTQGYGAYIGAKWQEHMPGVTAGAIWAIGALALYAAYTGSAGLSRFETWLSPFAGALVAVISGLFILSQPPPSAKSRTSTWISTGLFLAGAAVLLASLR